MKRVRRRPRHALFPVESSHVARKIIAQNWWLKDSLPKHGGVFGLRRHQQKENHEAHRSTRLIAS